jgi:hypothetical protein
MLIPKSISLRSTNFTSHTPKISKYVPISNPKPAIRIKSQTFSTNSKIDVGSSQPKCGIKKCDFKQISFETKHPQGRDYAVDFRSKEYGEFPDKLGNTVLHGAKSFRDMLGVAGNVRSGNIGEHYEKEAKPILDLKQSPRNAGALVALETHHWKNTEHEGSRELGSAMTELQRFGVLMHTRKALAKGEQPLPPLLALTALKNAIFQGQAAGFETVARTKDLSPEEMQGFKEGMEIWEKVKSEHTENGVFNRQTGIPALRKALGEADIKDLLLAGLAKNSFSNKIEE